MLKSLFNWRVLLNVLITIGLLIALVWGVFRWLEFHTNHGQEIEVPNIMNLNVKEAIGIIEEKGLTYEVDSFKYDPKYKSFQVLQVYPYIGSHVKDGRKIILRVNPKTWAKVAVPNLIDRYKQLAFRQLDLLGLKVKDTLYEPSISKDAVIRMEMNGRILKPGDLLPKFTEISLIIGEGPKRNVPIPNLIGLSMAEAKEILKQNYFELGIIESPEGKSDDNSMIYYQDPAVNSLRDQGMQVDLWVSHSPVEEMQDQIQILDQTYKLKEPEPDKLDPNTEMPLPPAIRPIENKPKPVEAKKIEVKKTEPKKEAKKEVKQDPKPKAKTVNKTKTEDIANKKTPNSKPKAKSVEKKSEVPVKKMIE